MAKIAFLLLCHKNPPRVLEQAKMLTARGDYVAIHLDGNAPASFYDEIRKGAADNPSVTFANRVKCGWGEWSLAKATLNLIDAAFTSFEDATHFYLMSGDCMPVKSAKSMHDALDASGQDMIEHSDFYEGNWIKTGMKEDRLEFRHWFNERGQKWLFYASLDMQRKLKLRREVPKDLKMRIGSQWWVLRRDTIAKIRQFLKERPDIPRFFKTTWIPDETFFQTLTTHLVPREQVVSRPPTLLMFSDYGLPVTFYADHFELLQNQDAFMARKISDHDDALRQNLSALFESDTPRSETSNSGTRLYDYVRERGRLGKRFGPRIWEAEAIIGPDVDVTLVVCKKWHVANRLIQTIKDGGILPAFGYIFDQEDADVPDLGNISSSRDKRTRHRRAYLNLLCTHHNTRKIAICLDPSNIDAVRDLASDGCNLRILEIECDLSDEWLMGHATRVGLGSEFDLGALNDSLLQTLRNNIIDEQHQLRELRHPHHYKIRQNSEPGKIARPIADAFGISIDQGAKAARTPHFFED